MTPDAQALAEILAKLNCEEGTQAWPSNWLPDARAALEWVAATLYAAGDAGDALRERLGVQLFGGRCTVGDWGAATAAESGNSQ